jgi:hypothetical protein
LEYNLLLKIELDTTVSVCKILNGRGALLEVVKQTRG